MNLCIPIKENNGLQSEVYSHFGSAYAFLLFDTEKEQVEIINNSDKKHSHGECEPMKSISSRDVNAVIVGGIGTRALEKLHALHIKVFKSKEGTAIENVKLFKKASLQEFTPDDGCAHHNRRHMRGEQ
ncbi:MAG: NifB/NifX family molybdenum-iron cluster-binding protein [Ignavibacteria bacterium]|nr:NifB/NifX family molybdenum-iron cluster-binding protein [Ignavibacteria bacterium]